MEKSRLMSMVEHSDWLENKYNNSMTKWRLHRLCVDFGKQPLEPWMFVPCKFVDGVWVVLEEPKECDCMGYVEDCFGRKNTYPGLEYQQAKERCLFEGFEYRWWNEEKTILDLFLNDDKWYLYYVTEGFFASNHNNIEQPKTIEDLVKYNLQLTPTAIKQIGL